MSTGMWDFFKMKPYAALCGLFAKNKILKEMKDQILYWC